VNNPGKKHMEILNGHYIGGKEIERKKDKLSRRRGLSSHYPKIMQLPILLIACRLPAKILQLNQKSK
jgi:hypothetical protein